MLGRLADERNLGDGGSSDVYAPSVVTVLDGLRAALPHAEVVHADGSDLAAAAASAASADVAIVVVGYTRADEGEFIGDSGTTHLRSLLPGPDEPDVVAAFEARLPSDRLAIEGSIPGSDALGFSTGGDRERLTLHDADEQLIESVATANPRTVVCLVAGSAVLTEAWRHHVPALAQIWYSGMQGGHGIADVLHGRRRRDGTPALHGRRGRRPPPSVRSRRDRGRLRRLARLLAPRPRSERARLPVRLRPVVHVMAAGPDHARRRRR